MVEHQLINLNGVSLATKSAGKGKDTIVFIHGNSMSSDNWLPQLENEELVDKYRLLSFDLPGHGKSKWLRNDATGYRPGNLAQLVSKLIDNYKLERYVLAGISYGTNIIGEITPPLQGCTGIMLASPCIVNHSFPASEILTPGPDGHVITAANPSDEELQGFVFCHMKNKEIALRYIESYRKTDPSFREELAKASIEGDLTDELENIKNWKLPVCVVFGKDETLIKD